MKKIFTLLCLVVSAMATSAQNLVIFTKGNAEPQVIALSDIEYMTVEPAGHADMTELVEFEVKNMSRFSFDVAVKMSNDCEKYIVGAMRGDIYTEELFAEQAEQTCDENAFFRPFEASIGNGDQVFPERMLGIHSIENLDDSNQPLKTVVAVYAIAKDGTTKVYSKEFLVPDVAVTASTNVEITATDVATDRFTVTINAVGDCAKMIYGVTSKEMLGGKSMSADLILKASQGLPVPYDGKALTINVGSIMTVSPGTVYYAYALPITSNGELGQVKYITVNTPAVVANGKGKVLTASGTLQTAGQYRSIAFPTLTFNDQVEKIRVMWCSTTDFESYKNIMAEVFNRQGNNNMAWTEYSIDAQPRALPVWHANDDYVLYIATVDKDGNVSEAQDILSMMGLGSTYKTQAAGGTPAAINFNGTATVDIVNDEMEKKYSPYDPSRVIEMNPYFTVTPGANLKNFIVVRVDVDAGNLQKELEEALVGYPAFYVGDGGVKYDFAYSDGKWTQIGGSKPEGFTSEGNAIRFKETWLSYDKVVFIAIDNNDRPSITHTYVLQETGGLKPYMTR